MCKITITPSPTLSGAIRVACPYLPKFPARAKALGGKWVEPHWVFDSRDQPRVEELLDEIYGHHGQPHDRATICVMVKQTMRAIQAPVVLFGRAVASARSRDGGARLGDGVILLGGKIDSGGSARYWETQILASTELELKDVPLGFLVDDEGNVRESDEDDSWRWEVRSIDRVAEPTPPAADPDAVSCTLTLTREQAGLLLLAIPAEGDDASVTADLRARRVEVLAAMQCVRAAILQAVSAT